MGHQLEELFNAPAEDIMDAILAGFRAQVDVKGKLAELYLHRYLLKLEEEGKIMNMEWVDDDGLPDFTCEYRGRTYQIECKNLRNEVYKKIPSYKVEIQKTRNSKDGSNTRSYRVDYFDILAVCTFNQTENWDFYFIKASDLEVVEKDHNLLKIMQRVPHRPNNKWRADIGNCL